jgi:hypothetical protein
MLASVRCSFRRSNVGGARSSPNQAAAFLIAAKPPVAKVRRGSRAEVQPDFRAKGSLRPTPGTDRVELSDTKRSFTAYDMIATHAEAQGERKCHWICLGFSAPTILSADVQIDRSYETQP